MKKMVIVFLVLSLMSILFAGSSLAADKIVIMLDGKELKSDAAPIMDQGRTLVPMRVIFEALGCEVEWIAQTQEIFAIKEPPQDGDTYQPGPIYDIKLQIDFPLSLIFYIEDIEALKAADWHGAFKWQTSGRFNEIKDAAHKKYGQVIYSDSFLDLYDNLVTSNTVIARLYIKRF